MSAPFDAHAIAKLGWRQGAVLRADLAAEARERAPRGIVFADGDRLIVTSHDCDVVNERLEKEPVVEVLRATVVTRDKRDKQQEWGRNPRTIQFAIADAAGGELEVAAKAHERWVIPREQLMREPPCMVLDAKTRRLIAEWLAKRYIRAAFPTAFDARRRLKMREWTRLLEDDSRWVQGVYLALNTLDELDERTPYKVDLIVAVPAAAIKDPAWAKKKLELESRVETFWNQFGPAIECVGVEVIPTSALTLAAIERYQRFDADWVSFADDSPATPIAADMTV